MSKTDLVLSCDEVKKNYANKYQDINNINEKIDSFISLAIDNFINSHSNTDVVSYVNFNFELFFGLYLSKFENNKNTPVIDSEEDLFIDSIKNDNISMDEKLSLIAPSYNNLVTDISLRHSDVPGINILASNFLNYAIERYLKNDYKISLNKYLNNLFKISFEEYISDNRIDVKKDGLHSCFLLDRYYSGDVKAKSLLVEEYLYMVDDVLKRIGNNDLKSRDDAIVCLVELIDIYLDKKPIYALSIYLHQRLYNRTYRKIHNISEQESIDIIPNGYYDCNTDNEVDDYVRTLYNGSSFLKKVKK